jgi:ankyrin repeat protein
MSEGMTPLARAAARGHARVVKLLLETRRVDLRRNDKPILLMVATARGYKSIVKLLLDHGAISGGYTSESSRHKKLCL